MAAYAPVTYKKAVADSLFDIPFDYLSKKFVQVHVEGVLKSYGSDYDFLDKTRVRFLKGAIPAGTAVMLSRKTDASTMLVSWRDASVLRAGDLEVSQLQLLHIAEEANVTADAALTGDAFKGWDAEGRRLTNLADAITATDAMNKRSVFALIEAAVAGVVGGIGWFVQAGVGAVKRTFQDKLREDLSALDFGCIPNGTTDNSLMLEAAAAAAGGGQSLSHAQKRGGFIGPLRLWPP